MSFKIFSHKLIIRKQNKHYAGFCSKLFKVSTTSVTLPENRVKHAPESENLRGSGLPHLPLISYIIIYIQIIYIIHHIYYIIYLVFISVSHNMLSSTVIIYCYHLLSSSVIICYHPLTLHHDWLSPQALLPALLQPLQTEVLQAPVLRLPLLVNTAASLRSSYIRNIRLRIRNMSFVLSYGYNRRHLNKCSFCRS